LHESSGGIAGLALAAIRTVDLNAQSDDMLDGFSVLLFGHVSQTGLQFGDLTD
jgi:hypothetical protein